MKCYVEVKGFRGGIDGEQQNLGNAIRALLNELFVADLPTFHATQKEAIAAAKEAAKTDPEAAKKVAIPELPNETNAYILDGEMSSEEPIIVVMIMIELTSIVRENPMSTLELYLQEPLIRLIRSRSVGVRKIVVHELPRFRIYERTFKDYE